MLCSSLCSVSHATGIVHPTQTMPTMQRKECARAHIGRALSVLRTARECQQNLLDTSAKIAHRCGGACQSHTAAHRLPSPTTARGWPRSEKKDKLVIRSCVVDPRVWSIECIASRQEDLHRANTTACKPCRQAVYAALDLCMSM